MTTAPEITPAAVALNRFGLGARPQEPVAAEPKAGLLAQLGNYAPNNAAWAAQPQSDQQVVAYLDYQKALRQADAGSEQSLRQKFGAATQAQYRLEVSARVSSAVASATPFAERLAHFWANHFAVSIEKPPVIALAGAFELEAIRPHVMGRFEDMLLAVTRHPAMLFYLDQTRSIGPNSPLGLRSERRAPQTPRGLNENLAREILELHTLGVRSGYSQDDVTEFARALTGWSVGGLPGMPPSAPGFYGFQPQLHEPGPRSVLGKRYGQAGEAQAAAVLHELCAAPATARHIVTKLARHFAGDIPAPALIERLAGSFQRSGGDLPTVYRSLVESPEVWAPTQLKFKTPWEWTLSVLRGLGRQDLGNQPIAQLLTQLGQTVWRPGSPAGFDDIADSWAAPDALLRRVTSAERLASLAGSGIDARRLALQLLPGGLSETTLTAITRADSPDIALALLFSSPEFLRR